ncbi:MAG: hypothetical protein ABIP68_08200 [Ferruginibacter sp.]
MKIEQLIVQYLYNNKSVTLQNIGTFEVSDDVRLPLDNEKDAVLPDNAFTFKYNPRAGQDDGLIDFIVSHTRKIKPLATSDLESYSITGKEYINIGKPFPIEGLGILEKSQNGDYEFIQGASVNPKIKEVRGENVIEKKEAAITFSTPARKSNTVRNVIIGVSVLIALLAIPAAIFYFYGNQPSENAVKEVKSDSLNYKKDSMVNVVQQPVATILSDDNFMVVIKKFNNKSSAENQLNRYDPANTKLMIYEKDSINFYVGLKVPSASLDSTRLMDSVNRFYAVKSFMEYIQK